MAASFLSKEEDSESSFAKPVVLYVTPSDAKGVKKLKAWEESRLADDKLIVASRLFKCYKMEEGAIPKDHPMTLLLKKNHAPTFLILHQGELMQGTGSSPSTAKIYAAMKKVISSVFKTSLDKIVKKGLDLKKDIEKVDNAKKEVDRKMVRLKKEDKRRTKYQKEMDELNEELNELRAKEAGLYDLKPKVTKA